MNKTTMASMALLISAGSAFGLVGPGGPKPKIITTCMAYHESETGLGRVRDCDETAKNTRLKLKLNADGCADGQVAMKSIHVSIPQCNSFAQL